MVVSATESEVSWLNEEKYPNLKIEKLISGVGMVATTFALTRKLIQESFDLVLNVGIAGSFAEEIGIGQVVQVLTDRIAELGAEDNDKFLPANQMGLVSTTDIFFVSSVQVQDLIEVGGITVNRVHGNANSIQRIIKEFDPDVESMEGAAVSFVSSKFEIPWVQIRAISNRVEPRNKENWNIPHAIVNLQTEVEKYLSKLNNEA